MMIRFSTSPVTPYTVGRKPLRLRFLIMPFCLALLGSYLTYHALQGERGYFAWGALSEKRADKDKELLALQSANAELLARIGLLSGPNPDPDYLDERVRDVLGFSAAGETVILFPSAD